MVLQSFSLNPADEDNNTSIRRDTDYSGSEYSRRSSSAQDQKLIQKKSKKKG